MPWPNICSRTGLTGFDLPTEAQWEYACRAGTDTDLYTGVNLTNGTTDLGLADIAYYGRRNNGALFVEVGSYQVNGWGLYDMLGNGWEICLDWARRILARRMCLTPKDLRGRIPTENGASAAAAGANANDLRASRRSWSGPSQHYGDMVFRLVYNPERD